jgi:predicted kinase
MIGIPRSGKTTLVHKNYSDCQIICADDIRYALHGKSFVPELENFVWGIHDTMIRANIFRHQNIVIDSTNTTPLGVRKYYDLANMHDYNLRYILVDTPYSLCWERNTELSPEWRRPVEVMERMRDQLKRLLSDPSSVVCGNLEYAVQD